MEHISRNPRGERAETPLHFCLLPTQTKHTPAASKSPPGTFRCQEWDAICMAHRGGEWQANMGRALTMSASCYIETSPIPDSSKGPFYHLSSPSKAAIQKWTLKAVSRGSYL